MTAWQDSRILDRLYDFVTEVGQSAVFRRTLRYQPERALAQHGLSGAVAPPQLPVRHFEIDVQVDAKHVFGLPSNSDAANIPLEMRLVAYGTKSMALVHGPSEELASLRRWSERRGLTALFSPLELQPVADDGKGGYSNFAYIRPVSDVPSRGLRELIVAQDDHQAMLGWLSRLLGWETFLAQLLGYPDCCIDAFRVRWQEASTEYQGDLSVMTLRHSGIGPFDWHMNIFGRYFGHSVTQHFPCSFTCTRTLEIAARYANDLTIYEPDYAQQLEPLLNAPVMYTEHSGVFILTQASIERNGDGYNVSYDPELCRATDLGTRLWYAVQSSDQISTLDNHTLEVGHEKVPGSIIWFGSRPAGE